MLRNLVERRQRLTNGDRFVLGHAVLIASPNEGTPLATPDKWQQTRRLDRKSSGPVPSQSRDVQRFHGRPLDCLVRQGGHRGRRRPGVHGCPAASRCRSCNGLRSPPSINIPRSFPTTRPIEGSLRAPSISASTASSRQPTTSSCRRREDGASTGCCDSIPAERVGLLRPGRQHPVGRGCADAYLLSSINAAPSIFSSRRCCVNRTTCRKCSWKSSSRTEPRASPRPRSRPQSADPEPSPISPVEHEPVRAEKPGLARRHGIAATGRPRAHGHLHPRGRCLRRRRRFGAAAARRLRWRARQRAVPDEQTSHCRTHGRLGPRRLSDQGAGGPLGRALCHAPKDQTLRRQQRAHAAP